MRAPKTKFLKSGAIAESSIHAVVMQFIKAHPVLRKVTIHIPNEGKRDAYYGNKLRMMGMCAGVFDLFLALPRRGYHGAWLELKSQDGTVSDDQRAFGESMLEQGYFIRVCYSIEQTIEVIEWYCSESL